MTKEITRAIILQEMQDKLALRELIPAKFSFEETVIPIYNIEQHLKSAAETYDEENITGTGGFSFFIVPATEKWTLHRYDVVFMGAGAYTVAGVYTRRFPMTVGYQTYLDLTAGQSTSYHVALPYPVTLYPKDALLINIDGYTSSQDLRLYIDYEVEEIR